MHQTLAQVIATELGQGGLINPGLGQGGLINPLLLIFSCFMGISSWDP